MVSIWFLFFLAGPSPSPAARRDINTTALLSSCSRLASSRLHTTHRSTSNSTPCRAAPIYTCLLLSPDPVIQIVSFLVVCAASKSSLVISMCSSYENAGTRPHSTCQTRIIHLLHMRTRNKPLAKEPSFVPLPLLPPTHYCLEQITGYSVRSADTLTLATPTMLAVCHNPRTGCPCHS